MIKPVFCDFNYSKWHKQWLSVTAGSYKCNHSSSFASLYMCLQKKSV